MRVAFILGVVGVLWYAVANMPPDTSTAYDRAEAECKRLKPSGLGVTLNDCIYARLKLIGAVPLEIR